MYNTLGHIFLNLAFGLYLVLYIPQLIHNSRFKNFAHMSFLMHVMLFQAYSCDLIYAVVKPMPWQYICVSCVGLICLSIQHIQWLMYCLKQKNNLFKPYVMTSCFVFGWPILLWLLTNNLHIIAWCSRMLFLLHFLPQIIKYHTHPAERDAIDIKYLLLSLSLSACDLGAAWCLSWDLPNLWGTFLSLILKFILLGQIILQNHYKSRLFFLKTRSAR